MEILLVAVISYMIGNFSSAYIVGMTKKGVDVRDHGSGNAGTTNVLRVLGKKAAAMTFILDFLKGVLALWIGKFIYGYDGKLIASVFVVLGHNYPILLKFQGGKGIATSIGILYALNWRVGIVATVIGLSTVYFSRYVSLGSIMGTVTAPILFHIFGGFTGNLRIAIIILMILSIFGHRSNIGRLLNGEENRI